jgi:hypothetical protein
MMADEESMPLVDDGKKEQDLSQDLNKILMGNYL